MKFTVLDHREQTKERPSSGCLKTAFCGVASSTQNAFAFLPFSGVIIVLFSMPRGELDCSDPAPLILVPRSWQRLCAWFLPGTLDPREGYTTSKASFGPGPGRGMASLLDPKGPQFKIGELEFALCR